MDIVASRRDARVVVVVVSVSTRQDGRPTSAWLLGGDQSHRDGGGVVSGPCRGASRGMGGGARIRGRRPAAARGWTVFHLPSTPWVPGVRSIAHGRSGLDLIAI